MLFDHVDYNQFIELCTSNNMEAIVEGNRVVITGPVPPSAELKQKIADAIGNDAKYEFAVSAKLSKIRSCQLLLSKFGYVRLIPNERALEINLPSGVEPNDPVFEDINRILSDDGFFQKWVVKNGKDVLYTYDRNLIKVAEQAAEQAEDRRVIQKDDVTDLHITLAGGSDEDIWAMFE